MQANNSYRHVGRKTASPHGSSALFAANTWSIGLILTECFDPLINAESAGPLSLHLWNETRALSAGSPVEPDTARVRICFAARKGVALTAPLDVVTASGISSFRQEFSS